METAKFRFVLFMVDPLFEHPEEDLLERYLLRQSAEEEIERVESHILACESCVTRLENLELEIAAMRRALLEVEAKQEARSAAPAVGKTKHRFVLPTWSWAGAAAAVALAIALVPQLLQHNQPADFSLSAYRGMETVVVPEDRPLHLTLNANDLPQGPAGVTIVDAEGNRIWSGLGRIENHRISVTIPRIARPGTHFVRLYSRAQEGAQPKLLREFSIDVQ